MERRVIRPAQFSEHAAVARVLGEAAESTHWTERELDELEKSGSQIFVAELTGDIVGAIVVRTAGGEAEILNLAVRAADRFHGIGRGLMSVAMASAVAHGAQRVFLEVRESNTGAQVFYAGLGYSQVGRRRYYYRDPQEDALLFSRPLP